MSCPQAKDNRARMTASERVYSCAIMQLHKYLWALHFTLSSECARVCGCVCGLHRFRHAPNNQPERMQNALFDDAWLICFRQYQRSTNCGRSRFATKHSKAPAWDQPLSATVIQLFSLGNGPHFARAFHRGAGPPTRTPSVGMCRAHMLGGHARGQGVALRSPAVAVLFGGVVVFLGDDEDIIWEQDEGEESDASLLDDARHRFAERNIANFGGGGVMH